MNFLLIATILIWIAVVVGLIAALTRFSPVIFPRLSSAQTFAKACFSLQDKNLALTDAGEPFQIQGASVFECGGWSLA